MKLLFDQNLSYKLVDKLSYYFPESNHVRLINLHEKDDLVIWKYAKEKEFVIVTKDADFYELALLLGSPPKVIWIRTGNHSTKHIIELIVSHREDIYSFNHSDKICLEIF